jgi:serine/threonine protein kinase/WD40 repeat protein
MSTPCFTPDELQRYLAGEAPSDQEDLVAEHLHHCSRCEGLVARLSDDAETRQWRTEFDRAKQHSPSVPDLSEMRERLHRLGLFDAAVPVHAPEVLRGTDDTQAAAVGSTGELPLRTATRETASETRAAEPPRPTCVGKFEIQQPIGSGGFGVVYLARDQVLNRKVALKLARGSVLSDPDLRVRFFREAEAAARLEHPGIVRVFEAGEQDGTCFLAMAYCEGPTLEQWLRDGRKNGVAPLIAARLALQLADAMDHAHAQGVLHRDIKPSNILLDAQPTRPGSNAPLEMVPRLADFGLARIAEHSSNTTISGVVLGTAQYMAPEQAAGLLDRIGPATDVYSLGAVLYEMLTGRPPIRGATTLDTLRRVLIDEPTAPQQLKAETPDDLGAIVMKCLDKSPTRRYTSASELAADLRRFLQGMPTVARPLSRRQRAARWIRRNPAAAVMASLALLVLVLGGGVYLSQREFADYRQEVIRRDLENSYREDIVAAQRDFTAGDVASAERLLRKYTPDGTSPDLREFAWHFLSAQVTHDAYGEFDAKADVYQMKLSPDGKSIALACSNSMLRILETETLREAVQVDTEQTEMNGVAWTGDGQRIACFGDTGTVRIYDRASRKLGEPWLVMPSGRAYSGEFYDRDRILIVCGEDNAVRLWDVATQREVGVLEEHGRAVEAIALSPDGRELATASSDDLAMVWDMESRKRRGTLSGHSSRLTSIAYSPDGKLLASGGIDGKVCLWKAQDLRLLDSVECFDGVQNVVFTADSQRLIAGDRKGTLRDFLLGSPDAAGDFTKFELASPTDAWHGHLPKVWSLTALDSGQRFLSGGSKVKAWRRGQEVVRWITSPDGAYQGCEFSRDGAQLFAACSPVGVEVRDGRTGQPLYTLDSDNQQICTVASLPGREQVAAGAEDGEILIWNSRSRTLLHQWKIPNAKWVDKLVYSPEANLLAANCFSRGQVILVEPNTGEQKGVMPAEVGNTLAFSPNGQRLVLDSLNSLLIYDVATGRQLRSIKAHTSTVGCIVFNAAGSLFASASDDRTIRVWSSEGDEVAVLQGHLAEVSALAFTADGRSLLSGGEDGMILIHHIPTQRELLRIPLDRGAIISIAVSPDGKRLAVATQRGELALVGSWSDLGPERN